jgi:hypothetical protein
VRLVGESPASGAREWPDGRGAAVDCEALATDVRRERRGEEDDRICDLPRRPSAAHRYPVVPNWNPGYMIPLGRNRMLRVVDVRPATDGGEEPVLVVVEDEPVRYPG